MRKNLQISNYGAIMSILAAPGPSKDVPHRPSTLPVACELFDRRLGPPGTMKWMADGADPDRR